MHDQARKNIKRDWKKKEEEEEEGRNEMENTNLRPSKVKKVININWLTTV